VQSPTDEALEIVRQIVDEVDDDLIYAIRVAADRDALLAQLDVLEKVRERLNVRCISS
jgi:hypothetical protein